MSCWVSGAKPVVRQILHPGGAQGGEGVLGAGQRRDTAPARTVSAMAASKPRVARWARSSSSSSPRNTSILDWPIVAWTYSSRPGVGRVVAVDADALEREQERRLDDAVVAHGGAGHVEHGEADRHRPAARRRPCRRGSLMRVLRSRSRVCFGDGGGEGHAPTPGTGHHPHARLRPGAGGRSTPSRAWEYTPVHRRTIGRQRPAQDRLGPLPQVRRRAPSAAAKSNGSS